MKFCNLRLKRDDTYNKRFPSRKNLDGLIIIPIEVTGAMKGLIKTDYLER